MRSATLEPRRAQVLGVPVHAVTLDAVVDACERAVEGRHRLTI